jgi:hypothetical protein
VSYLEQGDELDDVEGVDCAPHHPAVVARLGIPHVGPRALQLLQLAVHGLGLYVCAHAIQQGE